MYPNRPKKYMPEKPLEENLQEIKAPKEKKEQALYKIIADSLNYVRAIENMPVQKRGLFYAGFANMYKNLSEILEQKKEYKQESNLLNAFALAYATAAKQYSGMLENPKQKINYKQDV